MFYPQWYMNNDGVFVGNTGQYNVKGSRTIQLHKQIIKKNIKYGFQRISIIVIKNI